MFKFLPCPDRYCCSDVMNQCKSITTCNKNRQGRLCGRCKYGTYINFFNNNCIAIERCAKTEKMFFWLFFFSTPIFLSLIIMFAKDLKENTKAVFGKLTSAIISRCCILYRRTKDYNIDADTTLESEDSFSFSGIFNILVSFYQIKSLIQIQPSSSTITIIDNIFDAKIFATNTQQMEAYCPFETIDVISRETLAGYGFSIIMVTTVLLALVLRKCAYKLQLRFSSVSGDKMFGRYYAGYYAVLAFCYKNISRLAG